VHPAHTLTPHTITLALALTQTHSYTHSLSHSHSHFILTHALHTIPDGEKIARETSRQVRCVCVYVFVHVCVYGFASLTHFKPCHIITSQYTTLHYTSLHYIILHYTKLHYTTLHYTTLHYTTLHCTTLHYTAQHCSMELAGKHRRKVEQVVKQLQDMKTQVRIKSVRVRRVYVSECCVKRLHEVHIHTHIHTHHSLTHTHTHIYTHQSHTHTHY
jgi:hypothetical protein